MPLHCLFDVLSFSAGPHGDTKKHAYDKQNGALRLPVGSAVAVAFVFVILFSACRPATQGKRFRRIERGLRVCRRLGSWRCLSRPAARRHRENDDGEQSGDCRSDVGSAVAVVFVFVASLSDTGTTITENRTGKRNETFKMFVWEPQGLNNVSF